MGRKLESYNGMRIGNFTVRERVDEFDDNGQRKVRVVCDCGTEYIVPMYRIKKRSLGCASCGRGTKGSHIGFSAEDGKLYRRWRGMLGRCENRRDPGYLNYGGRGIFVCEEWHRFPVFRDWMLANGYTMEKSGELSVERVDNDGPYSPENCELISISAQQRNRRNTVHVTDPETGKVMCASEYAFLSGRSSLNIIQRMKAGKPLPPKLKGTDVYSISACHGDEVVKTFSSLRNAQSWWNNESRKIGACLRGETDTAAGMGWYFTTAGGERYKLNKDNEYVRVGV